MADQMTFRTSARPRIRVAGVDPRRSWYPLLLVILSLLITVGGAAGIGATHAGPWIVAGMLAFIAAMVIMIRPDVGLYILVVFVFMNLSDVLEVNFGIPSTNKPLVALIFVGTLASRVVLHRKPLIFRGTEMIIMAFGVVTLLSLLATENQSQARKIMIDWAKDYAILFVVIQLAGEEEIWKRMQWTLILSAAFLSLLSVFQVATHQYGNSFWGLANAPIHEVVTGYDSNRITGPLDDPNYYAMVILMTVPLAAYRMFSERRRLLRIVGGVAFVLTTATVLFTYSRGAFLGLLVVGILIVRERRFNPYKIVLGLAVLLLLVTPVLPVKFADRLRTITDIFGSSAQEQTDVSIRGRSSEMIVATRMFRDYPLLGVGRGNYAASYLDYSPQLGLDARLENRQAHSLYLELAAETGIVGIVVFGGMLIVLFMGIRQAKRLLRQANRYDLIPWVTGIQCALLAYLLASLFLHADYVRYLWLIVGFAASSSVMAEEQYCRFTTGRSLE